VPMGAEVALEGAPRFRARAMGARGQRPGCPDEVLAGLGAERTTHVCADSCYFPDDTRHRIEAIEVVRVLPRRTPDEPLEGLISDPWKTFPCEAGPEGCDVTFEDPAFPALGREAIYYVRAIQEPTPAINGDPLRCERDAAGRCIEARPCREDPEAGDCLAPVRERAWSSPIFARPASR